MHPTEEPSDVAVAPRSTRADCGVVEKRCPFLEFRLATTGATDSADTSDAHGSALVIGGVISGILEKIRALVRKVKHDPDADISPGLAKFFRRESPSSSGSCAAKNAAKTLSGLIGARELFLGASVLSRTVVVRSPNSIASHDYTVFCRSTTWQ
eukprot:m51a1_g4970 hypothetical protein (154) ;mRNA; r:395394-395964